MIKSLTDLSFCDICNIAMGYPEKSIILIIMIIEFLVRFTVYSYIAVSYDNDYAISTSAG